MRKNKFIKEIYIINEEEYNLNEKDIISLIEFVKKLINSNEIFKNENLKKFYFLDKNNFKQLYKTKIENCLFI
jgi:hypothetical protein